MERIDLYIPQWQGSGHTRELLSGAKALKTYIESRSKCSFHDIEVCHDENIDLKNNIVGHDVIVNQLSRLQDALNKKRPSKIFTIGGGCGIEIPVVSHLMQIYDDLTLYWFDAHGDLNTPESSPSKYFHGMPLRFLTDKTVNLDGIAIENVPHDRVNLMGVRDLDEAEVRYIDEKRISVISVEELKNENFYREKIMKCPGKAYIHIDLDVLDPQFYKNVKCPTESGLSIEELTNAIGIIKKHMGIVGFSIVENTEQEASGIMKLNKIIDIGTGI